MKASRTNGKLIKRLARLTVAGVTDQFDKLGMVPPVLARELQPLGTHVKFAGVAFCVKGRKRKGAGWKATPGPRDVLFDSLDARLGAGVVLVFDTGGYDDTAVFGAGMGLVLKQCGGAGAIIDVAVRDVAELASIGLPTWARAVSAIRFMGRFAVTAIDCPIEIRGLTGPVRVEPGDLVLADDDGVIVVPVAVAEQVIGPAEQAARVEALVKAEVLRGVPRLKAARRHGKY